MEGIITGIEEQKRSKDRVNIYIDGEYYMSLSTYVLFKLGLKKGEKIDGEKLKNASKEDELIKCRESALKIIEKSFKTEKEVYDKLIEKGYSEENVQSAIKSLQSYNFLNDDKYVQMYIKEKISSWGSGKIRFNLMKKGIDKNIIEEKMENFKDSEMDAAQRLAFKRYDIIRKRESDQRKIYKKLGSYLASNGYDYGIIKNVLDKVLRSDS